MLQATLKLGSSLLAAATLLASGLNATEYELIKSEIRWSGSMPAKTHEGLISLYSCEVEIADDGTITTLNAVVDMRTIEVADLTDKNRKKLTDHLLSKDFFYVEKHPTARFELDQHAGGLLHGTLTIRGVSSKVALPVKVSGNPDRGWIVVGNFDFDRIFYGVDYQNLALFSAAKSKLINNSIEVSVSLLFSPAVP